MDPDVVHGDLMCSSCRGVKINVHAECVIICRGHIFNVMHVYVTSSFLCFYAKLKAAPSPLMCLCFPFSRRSPE